VTRPAAVTRFRAEIGEQPQTTARLLERAQRPVQRAAAAIAAADPAAILIAARGSSDHAATYAKYLFGVRNRIPVALAAPSAFTLYCRPPRLARVCTIGISQSGASPDVIAVLREARRQGSLTLAITNEPHSALADVADHVLRCHAGAERSVPASKTFAASLLILAMLSQALHSTMAFQRALSAVPSALARTLAQEDQVRAAAAGLRARRLAVLGRGYHLATAQEIALKVVETSYVMADAQSVADFLHGPIAMVESGFPVLLLAARGPTQRAMRAIAAQLMRRGARLLQFSDTRGAISPGARGVLIETGLPEPLTPLPFALAGQLFAHHLAVGLGLDPDRPRGLRKVTLTL